MHGGLLTVRDDVVQVRERRRGRHLFRTGAALLLQAGSGESAVLLGVPEGYASSRPFARLIRIW